MSPYVSNRTASMASSPLRADFLRANGSDEPRIPQSRQATDVAAYRIALVIDGVDVTAYATKGGQVSSFPHFSSAICPPTRREDSGASAAGVGGRLATQ